MTTPAPRARTLAALLLTAALTGCALPAVGTGQGLPGDATRSAAPATTSQPMTTAPSTPTASSTTAGATSSTTAATGPGTAAAALARLHVKGRAGMGGYSRAQFGQAWADTDRNGCDQRNDVLRRDLTDKVMKAGTGGCVVLSGTFHDPYSGTTMHFVRGAGSAEVQIDHVVALGDAWQSGAQQWTLARRTAYATDPLVLMASNGSLNQQKQASNAASWLPPNKAFRCQYVARQVAIKTKYHLSVTRAEHDAIARVLAKCPTQKLPTAAQVRTPPRDTTAPTGTQPGPSSTPTTPPPANGDVYYANCDAVRAAGAAPLHRGDPGWQDKFDRDGDGVACE